MKKCVSCAKDLPDAALHCVFCGAKQAPIAPSPAAGPPPGGGGLQAKTVMGWQASDVLAGLQGKPTLVPGDLMASPPPAPPAGPPPGLGHASTVAAGPSPVAAPPAQPLGTAATMMATAESLGINVPQAAPPPAAPPAAQKTMFVQGPAPGQAPPAAAAPPLAAAPPPASGASTMFQPSPFANGQNPMATMPAPAPAAPPPAASGASTMFQPSPFANGQNPMATMPAPAGMGGPPPGMGGPMGGPPPGMGGMPGMSPPPPGMQALPASMGGMPGMGGPPPGMGGMPGMGGPPPGMGGMPGMGGPMGPGPMGQPGMGPPMGQGPMGQPHMGQGPMGQPGGYQQPGYPQQPGMPPMGGMPQAGQPYGSPPYLASRSAARAGAPFEPYNDALKTCLIIFGLLLIAAFAVPMTVKPAMSFRWDALKAENLTALAKFDHIYLAAAGVLALVFGFVPLATVPRGALAAVLGLVPLVLGLVNHLKGPKVEWQVLVGFVGSLTLVAGLLLRGEYRNASLGRLLATVGALCIIVPLLVPHGGGDPPIKGIITMLTDAPGKAKVVAFTLLLPFILAVASFAVWLPAPSSAGAKVIAWLFILTGVITAYTALLVKGHLADVLKTNLNNALLSGWIVAAWAALLGYGLATVFGKNLEQQG